MSTGTGWVEPMVNRWMLSWLRGDATVMNGLQSRQVGPYAVPDGTPYPHVIWQVISASDDVSARGGARRMVGVRCQLTIWTEGRSTDSIDDLAIAVDARLHRAPAQQITGGRLLSCVRLRELPFPPVNEDGKWYARLAADYWLQVQRT